MQEEKQKVILKENQNSIIAENIENANIIIFNEDENIKELLRSIQNNIEKMLNIIEQIKIQPVRPIEKENATMGL